MAAAAAGRRELVWGLDVAPCQSRPLDPSITRAEPDKLPVKVYFLELLFWVFKAAFPRISFLRLGVRPLPALQIPCYWRPHASSLWEGGRNRIQAGILKGNSCFQHLPSMSRYP